jgi:hypothetical protein
MMLSYDGLKILLRYLFDTDKTEGNMSKVKCLLVIIFNRHLANGGNRLKPEETELFVCSWGEYTKLDRLLKLLTQLDNC